MRIYGLLCTASNPVNFVKYVFSLHQNSRLHKNSQMPDQNLKYPPAPQILQRNPIEQCLTLIIPDGKNTSPRLLLKIATMTKEIYQIFLTIPLTEQQFLISAAERNIASQLQRYGQYSSVFIGKPQWMTGQKHGERVSRVGGLLKTGMNKP